MVGDLTFERFGDLQSDSDGRVLATVATGGPGPSGHAVPVVLQCRGDGLPVPLPQVPAAAVLGAGRPEARHRRGAQRGARRPRRSRVSLLRPTRHRQDHDGAPARQGAQLPRPRAPTASRAASARTASAIADGRFFDLFELDAASNNGVDAMRDLIQSVHLGLGAHVDDKVYIDRRGAHAQHRRVEHAAEDARGAARARRVRARHHRSAEGAAHDPVAHAALRVHAAVARRDRRPPRRRRRTGRHRGRRRRRSTLIARARRRVRRATRCRCSTRRSPHGGSSTPSRSARCSAAPFELRVAVLEAVAGEDVAGALVARPRAARRRVTTRAASPTICSRTAARRVPARERQGARARTTRPRTRSRGSPRSASRSGPRAARAHASRCSVRRSSTSAAPTPPIRASCSRSRVVRLARREARTRRWRHCSTASSGSSSSSADGASPRRGTTVRAARPTPQPTRAAAGTPVGGPAKTIRARAASAEPAPPQPRRAEPAPPEPRPAPPDPPRAGNRPARSTPSTSTT